MEEISGEVDDIIKDQIMAPGIPRPNHKTIPVLRIRLKTTDRKLVQIIYKGDYPGDVSVGQELTVVGVNKGGVIHAISIFNKTTNSWTTKKGGCLNCLIATAVYGSSYSNEVVQLRYFRDDFLMRNKLGREFVTFYYKRSPSIAKLIEKHQFIKLVTKHFLVKPCFGLARVYSIKARNKGF